MSRFYATNVIRFIDHHLGANDPLREFTGLSDECRTALGMRRPLNQANRLQRQIRLLDQLLATTFAITIYYFYAPL